MLANSGPFSALQIESVSGGDAVNLGTISGRPLVTQLRLLHGPLLLAKIVIVVGDNAATIQDDL